MMNIVMRIIFLSIGSLIYEITRSLIYVRTHKYISRRTRPVKYVINKLVNEDIISLPPGPTGSLLTNSDTQHHLYKIKSLLKYLSIQNI